MNKRTNKGTPLALPVKARFR